MTPASKRKPLVLGARPVDAEVTPPPEGYVPAQAAAPADPSPADNSASMPPADAAPDSSSGSAPAGDALDPPDPRDLDAAQAALDRARNALNDNDRTPAPPANSARNAQNDGGDVDADDADDADGDETEYTYASENQVQAARLVLRAFAKARDSVVPKATAARAAIGELQAMGGNIDQVRMVLADARVKPREIGLKADGTPL